MLISLFFCLFAVDGANIETVKNLFPKAETLKVETPKTDKDVAR